jgi:hypothetical protein
MREEGYTLIDLIITCLLVIGTASLGLTGLQGMIEHHKLQAACQGMVSDLSRARVTAIAANLPVTVKIRKDRRAYSVTELGEAVRWRELPAGVAFSGGPKTELTFHSRGSATPAATYALLGRAGEISVIVSASGRLRWTRGE